VLKTRVGQVTSEHGVYRVWDLRSSGTLRSLKWLLVTDVSKQPNGPIIKDRASSVEFYLVTDVSKQPNGPIIQGRTSSGDF